MIYFSSFLTLKELKIIEIPLPQNICSQLADWLSQLFLVLKFWWVAMNLVSIECPKVTAVGKSVIFVMCLCPMRESWPYCVYLHGPLSYWWQLSSLRCSELCAQPLSPKQEDEKIAQYFQFGFSSEMVYDKRVSSTLNKMVLILWFILLFNIF